MDKAGKTNRVSIRQWVEGDLDVVTRHHTSSPVDLGEDLRIDV